MSLNLLSLREVEQDAPPKPWQRLAGLMFINGESFNEISRSINQPVEEISAFITSDRGKELTKTLIGSNEDRLSAMLEAAAVDSILSLVKIRDTSSSDSARVSAACQILDRGVAKIKAGQTTTRKRASARDLDSIENQIRSLKTELLAKE
jgi:hypothetical protein